MIYTIRGKQVMVDSDLANLYQVTTKRLNEQVRRNKNRFPPEFMFRLTADEYEYLRSQFVTSSESKHGGRRYMPYVFTEQGIAILFQLTSSNTSKISFFDQISGTGYRGFASLSALLAISP